MINTATKIMTAEAQITATDRDATETLFNSSLTPALSLPQLMLTSIDVVMELENSW